MTVKYISKYSSSRSDKAVIAGLKGDPKVYVAGGDYARGTITWASIQVQDETITLGGVYVKFTSAASDGTKAGTALDPLLVNIKGTLSLTLDELVIVLNATANATIATCTYSKSGTTILSIVKDTRGSAGNSFTLAASVGTVSAATLTTGHDDVAISLNDESIDLQLTDANDQYFTIANGVSHQKKVIVLSAKSTGNAIITVANLDGSASVVLTLSTAGQYVILQFLDDQWRTLSNSSTNTATLAEITRAADVSTRLQSITTTPVSATEAVNEGRITVLNKADGATITLPAATGSGGKYTFIVGTTVTSNSYIIKVADATDIMDGIIYAADDTATPVPLVWVTAADSDTITLDGSTQGGIIGDRIELVDIAVNQWVVHGFVKQSGTEATPFSATVA